MVIANCEVNQFRYKNLVQKTNLNTFDMISTLSHIKQQIVFIHFTDIFTIPNKTPKIKIISNRPRLKKKTIKFFQSGSKLKQ